MPRSAMPRRHRRLGQAPGEQAAEVSARKTTDEHHARLPGKCTKPDRSSGTTAVVLIAVDRTFFSALADWIEADAGEGQHRDQQETHAGNEKAAIDPRGEHQQPRRLPLALSCGQESGGQRSRCDFPMR